MNKLLLGTAFIGASLLIGGVAHADTNVYRLYNHNTGEHFYTTSGTEKNANVSAGWTYEGIGWVAPTTSSSPVYRVYNPNPMGGDHYYTKSKYEAQSLVNKGWKWDNNGKAVFYSGGSQAVYVAYNPNAQSGAHNYTESSFEQNSLLNTGWKYGAVAWYGIAPSKPATGTITLSGGDYIVGKNIPAGTYNVTSPGASGTDTYLQYSTGAPNYDGKGFYITSKATSINFTTGMEVTIITSGNAKTVVFTPVK
ncbi:hypothetical protein [Lactococcus cremoris]|uniref:DUF5648 domain-containing protein n=1 Tax=Lactococcus cremoris subsp. tructae TaxID=542833 RepID=A0A2A5SXK4_LACLC|nr:hypothetical protein [Lactococcus cremoris]PCS20670.1 hypothetical protein RU92_GL000318 [Lactococcus cremoris subsp. tructae]